MSLVAAKRKFAKGTLLVLNTHGVSCCLVGEPGKVVKSGDVCVVIDECDMPYESATWCVMFSDGVMCGKAILMKSCDNYCHTSSCRGSIK